MAVIETWFKQDLNTAVKPRSFPGEVFNNDSLGNLIGVEVTKDGESVSLTGSVNGYCILSNGETIPVVGTRSGNKASIILPQTAYSVRGIIKITLKLTDGQATTTLLQVVGAVDQSVTENMVNPGSVVQDWSQQIAAAMQELHDLENNYVRVDTASQGLTETKKSNGRTNIDAASVADLNDLKSAITKNDIVYPFEYSGILNAGYAANAGTWASTTSSSLCHTVIPIKPGAKIHAVIGSVIASEIAILTEYTKPSDGETVHFSTSDGWTGVISLAKNSTNDFVAPNDAVWLYLNLGNRNTGYTRTPVVLEIDGYNFIKSVKDNILDRAPIESPSFTGTPTAPTQSANDNSTKIATTAYTHAADNAVKELIKTNYFTFESGYATSLSNVGKAPDAADRINIDTLITPGNYKVTTSSAAASLDGDVPTSDIGYKLVVMETTQDNRVYQIAYPNGNTRIRYRKYNGTTWSSWEVLLTQADIESRIEAAKADLIAMNPARIRIMQYNCGAWSMGVHEDMTSANFQTKMDNYRRFFCKYHPDVIGIQEWVDELTISGLSGTQSINAELFTPMYPYHMDYIIDGSTKGRTVKSRFEPISVSKGKINAADFGYTGNCLYSKMILNYQGRRVAVLSTAFIPTSSISEDIPIRAALMPLLLDVIKNEDYAFLVCDANNGGNKSDVSPENEGDALNAIAEANGFKAAMGPYYPWTDSYKSYSQPYKYAPIDNIFYKDNGKTQLVDYQVLMNEYDNLFSDHAPCIGDFILL